MVKAISAVLLAFACALLAPAQAAKNEQIRVFLPIHPYSELLKGAIPDFEDANGIQVVVEFYQENQLTSKLTADFSARADSADVFLTRPLQEGKLFSRNGWYEPLEMDFSDYPRNVMSVVSFNQKVYAVPLITEWQVLYYRRDIFRKLGLKVPSTFVELEEAAKRIHSPEVAGFASRGRKATAVTQLSSFIYNYGGNYLDSGEAVFDSSAALEAIRFYGRLVANYGPKNVTSMSWEELEQLFQAGKVAMWTDTSVHYGALIDPAHSRVPARDVAVSHFPAGPRYSSPYIVPGWGMAVAAQSKRKNLALRFVEWATSRELAVTAMLANITMARTSVWEDKRVVSKINPSLVETRAYAASNGFPLDRPYMSAVGEARELIGDLIVESINSRGESPRLGAMATDRVAKVNELLQKAGEFGK